MGQAKEEEEGEEGADPSRAWTELGSPSSQCPSGAATENRSSEDRCLLSLKLLHQQWCVEAAACISYGTNAEPPGDVSGPSWLPPEGTVQHSGHQAWHPYALARPQAQLGTGTLSLCWLCRYRHGLTWVPCSTHAGNHSRRSKTRGGWEEAQWARTLHSPETEEEKGAR